MRAVLFDFETTGLLFHPEAPPELQPRIIEVGAVLVSASAGVVEQLSALVAPGIPLPPEITKITGIRAEDLADAPPLVDVLPELERMFADADVSIAHNHPFDESVLRAELQRLPHGGSRRGGWRWPSKKLCTVQAYAEAWGRRPRLTELYEHVLGKPLAQTHRALDDVMALWEVVQHEGLLS